MTDTVHSIPRLLLDPSFIGISPEYVDKELERDKAEHGANDFTVSAVSGTSPADAFNGAKFAHPVPAAHELLPQFRGTRCLSRYPLSECPFPGQCPPAVPGSRAATEPNGTLPCAMWATGEPQALSRYLADEGQSGGMSVLREQVLDWDIDGQWKDDLWHPCACARIAGRCAHSRCQTTRFSRGRRSRFTFTRQMRCTDVLSGNASYSRATAWCATVASVRALPDAAQVRQLFYRTINYLRQLPTSVEHVFDWGTSSYQSFRNGTGALPRIRHAFA